MNNFPLFFNANGLCVLPFNDSFTGSVVGSQRKIRRVRLRLAIPISTASLSAPDCKKCCFPHVDKIALFLRDSPTPICESVNSHNSHGRQFRRVQSWYCKFQIIGNIHQLMKLGTAKQLGTLVSSQRCLYSSQ